MNRHRDLSGRGWHPWVHRVLLGLVAVVALLALLNVFGQRPRRALAGSAVASLSVEAPTRIRSGLLYTVAFRVTARRELKKAFLVLDSGWFDGMQVNSVVP